MTVIQQLTLLVTYAIFITAFLLLIDNCFQKGQQCVHNNNNNNSNKILLFQTPLQLKPQLWIMTYKLRVSRRGFCILDIGTASSPFHFLLSAQDTDMMPMKLTACFFHQKLCDRKVERSGAPDVILVLPYCPGPLLLRPLMA